MNYEFQMVFHMNVKLPSFDDRIDVIWCDLTDIMLNSYDLVGFSLVKVDSEMMTLNVF